MRSIDTGGGHFVGFNYEHAFVVGADPESFFTAVTLRAKNVPNLPYSTVQKHKGNIQFVKSPASPDFLDKIRGRTVFVGVSLENNEDFFHWARNNWEKAWAWVEVVPAEGMEESWKQEFSGHPFLKERFISRRILLNNIWPLTISSAKTELVKMAFEKGAETDLFDLLSFGAGSKEWREFEEKYGLPHSLVCSARGWEGRC